MSRRSVRWGAVGIVAVVVLAAVTTQAGTRHTSDALLEWPRVRVRGTTTIRALAWMVAEWRE